MESTKFVWEKNSSDATIQMKPLLAVLSHGTFCFSAFYKNTEEIFTIFSLTTFRGKGFNIMSSVIYVIGRFKILVLQKMIFLF